MDRLASIFIEDVKHWLFSWVYCFIKQTPGNKEINVIDTIRSDDRLRLDYLDERRNTDNDPDLKFEGVRSLINY